MAAAEKYGLDLGRLCEAVDSGIIRGRLHDVAGSHPIRTVDEEALTDYLQTRPKCAYAGCEQRATLASEACGAPHARALETRGTRRPGDVCRKISAGKTGKLRPDVRERVAAMHADPAQRYRWGLRFAEGRKLPPTSQRRWKNRVNGLKGHRPPVEVSDADRAEIWRLKDLGFGRRTIPEHVEGTTEDVVRRVLSEPRPIPNAFPPPIAA